MHLALDDRELDALADALAARIIERLQAHGGKSAPRGWLDSRAAADYLGLPSVAQLHKLTSARVIAFSQERPGAACYFRVDDLDAYRQNFMKAA